MRYVVRGIAAVIILLVVATAAVIGFDGPNAPPPLASISTPFDTVDFSKLPPVTRFTARDGVQLAYRRYDGDPDRLVILVHGSAGSSISMHPLAEALAAKGATVIVPDIRGHGQSGKLGDIAYVGQLEDDLEDLLNTLDRSHQPKQITLIGFSSGGGFVLRVAGGRLGPRFSRYILLAPFLRYDAPNARPGPAGSESGGWVDVAIPRIVGLQLINRIGITAFNGLPVLAFAVDSGNPAHLTATYSYRLMTNFAPDNDYIGDLRRDPEPLMAMDGANDELFQADKLQSALAAGKPGVRVDIVPGVGHITLVTTRAGTAAIANAWASNF
jgi:pimeloyl-ACP methyl ester carboxylesterase